MQHRTHLHAPASTYCIPYLHKAPSILTIKRCLDSCGRIRIDAAGSAWKLHSQVDSETCWAQAFTTAAAAAGTGEGSSSSSSSNGRMGEAAGQQSPRHRDKRYRLSRLLDRLTVQICNNNHYEAPHWLMIGTPLEPFCQTKPEDMPLDLSKKPNKAQVQVPRKKETFSCGVCGQAFAVHDRLAKHIACRHRARTPDSARQFSCASCQRRFARSDMLTRHARLHSGVKPYACAECGQVFSRSDHLATHRRTHTGEKPYRCPAPACAYAACRRDMITRHMRTHNKHNAA